MISLHFLYPLSTYSLYTPFLLTPSILPLYSLFYSGIIIPYSKFGVYIIYIYIYYIHPELRIRDYPSGSGKGAGPL